MKVSDLVKIIEGVATGLSGISKPASEGLLAFHVGMRPFAELNVPDFMAFLASCDEYKRTGIIPAGKAKGTTGQKSKINKANPPPSVEEGATLFRDLLAKIAHGGGSGPMIDDLANKLMTMSGNDLKSLLKVLDLKATSKTKGDSVGNMKQVLDNHLEMYIKTHRRDESATSPGHS